MRASTGNAIISCSSQTPSPALPGAVDPCRTAQLSMVALEVEAGTALVHNGNDSTQPAQPSTVDLELDAPPTKGSDSTPSKHAGLDLKAGTANPYNGTDAMCSKRDALDLEASTSNGIDSAPRRHVDPDLEAGTTNPYNARNDNIQPAPIEHVVIHLETGGTNPYHGTDSTQPAPSEHVTLGHEPGTSNGTGSVLSKHASFGLEAGTTATQLATREHQAFDAAPQAAAGEGQRPSLDGHSSAACWICLCGPEEGELTAPCKCVGLVSHPHCLARWQLHRHGKDEEVTCRFCKSPLPPWVDILSGGDKQAALQLQQHAEELNPTPEGLSRRSLLMVLCCALTTGGVVAGVLIVFVMRFLRRL